MLETLTVFDDVFVPWERVFCFRQPELAGPIALAFVEYHRFTAVSYKLPLLDALVGAAAEIARMNGVIRAGHIKDKLTQLVIYAETVRTLCETAARRGQVGADGFCRPDSATTNIAKYTFATGFHDAVRIGAGLRGRAARHRARRRRLGQPRSPSRAREVLRAPPRRRPSASR